MPRPTKAIHRILSLLQPFCRDHRRVIFDLLPSLMYGDIISKGYGLFAFHLCNYGFARLQH
jgi:hypothetical protein